CFPEELNATPDLCRDEFVPMVTTFQIKIVCFKILCRTIGQPLSLLIAQRHCQSTRHPFRDGVLYGEHIGCLLVERASPQRRAVLDVDESSGQTNAVG